MHLNHLNDPSHDSGKLSIIIHSYEQGLRVFYYTEYDDADENCDQRLLSRKSRLNFFPECQKCTLIGSCNGLICFNLYHGPDSHGPACIYNPITRECITLPNDNGKYFWNGFGYSPLTNEYKVVRICHRWCRSGASFGFAQVYTVGDGNGWRCLGEMDVKWEPMKCVATCAGAFVNGALHWVNLDSGAILAFDLTNEKFSERPSLPCLTQDGVPYIRLGVLGDVLSATHCQEGNCSKIIWLMKNEDNFEWTWSKQFSFDYCGWMSFEFTKSGRILWYGLHGGIYIYDPKVSSTIKDISFCIDIVGAIPHKNSLVSLKALGEKDAKIMEFPERARSMEVIGRSA